MPWHVAKKGGKYVVRKGHAGMGGKIVGTHDTPEKANAHVRALYANTKDEPEPKRPA